MDQTVARPSGRRSVHVVRVAEAGRVFVRHTTPRILLGAGTATVLVRVALGRWSPSDAVVVAAFLLAQPFTEWLIHVHVLHVQAGGRVTRALDRAAGLAHRLHHQDPYDLRWQFIHPAVAWGQLVLLAVLVAVLHSPAAVTGAVTTMLLTLTYEWVHFLIHTDVPARHWPYTQLHRAHRLHHYRNESYWLGVTGHLGDRVLGTYPAKQDVPVSPTARTALARLNR